MLRNMAIADVQLTNDGEFAVKNKPEEIKQNQPLVSDLLPKVESPSLQ